MKRIENSVGRCLDGKFVIGRKRSRMVDHVSELAGEIRCQDHANTVREALGEQHSSTSVVCRIRPTEYPNGVDIISTEFLCRF